MFQYRCRDNISSGIAVPIEREFFVNAGKPSDQQLCEAHQVGGILPNSPDVRLHTAPGGHLGVLAGGAARGTTWALIDEFLDAHPA
jgi:hypothetical protein